MLYILVLCCSLVLGTEVLSPLTFMSVPRLQISRVSQPDHSVEYKIQHEQGNTIKTQTSGES